MVGGVTEKYHRKCTRNEYYKIQRAEVNVARRRKQQ